MAKTKLNDTCVKCKQVPTGPVNGGTATSPLINGMTYKFNLCPGCWEEFIKWTSQDSKKK